MTDQSYCYCPAALQELRTARSACVEATNLLRQRDPDYDAREALKRATLELHEARDLLQRVLGANTLLEELRDVPRLCTLARTAIESADGALAVANLSRIHELLPGVERIEKLLDRLDNTEIRVVYADA